MMRTVIGAVVGMGVGMLVLAGWGAYYGYMNGLASAKLPCTCSAAGALTSFAISDKVSIASVARRTALLAACIEGERQW